MPWTSYPDTGSRLAFTGRLMDALAAEPGVVASGISTNVPFSGNTNKSSATVVGYLPPPGAPPRAIYQYAVAGDYFKAMGIPLVEGRLLSRADDRAGSNSVVVDEDFARYYWPRGDAIGQRLFIGSTAGPLEEAYVVVGVVGAVKQAGLASEETLGAVYFPYSDRFDSNVYVVSRTSGDPDALGATLQQIVRTLNPELPVNNLRAMQVRIDNSLLTRRSPALLSVIFAAIALMLTAVGTYGVLSYAVTLRRREIGLRMALGADPGQVRWEFVRMAGRLLVFGTIVGLAGAWMTGHAMSALLFHVAPVSLPVLGTATFVLGAVCLAACFVPSWRASRISPAESLAEL
jgi:predicted permease